MTTTTNTSDAAPGQLRVGLYCRVSTDLQASRDEGSLETQERSLRSVAEGRWPGCEVATVYREEGASGKDLKRPEVQRLLRDVREQRIDLVMMTRLDRLTRSLTDFFEMQRLFTEHEVRFVSLRESFDTTSPIGAFAIKLLLLVAELEREQTAERTRIAYEQRARRGLWNGGHPPLGYVSDGHGHLLVVEKNAALVRQIFDRYLELGSVNRVVAWLHENGHRQRRYHSRRKGDKGGGAFSYTVVRTMLRNRIYVGDIVHKKQVVASGQHEAIVDELVFERVQEMITSHAKRVYRKRPKEVEYDFLLTGLLRCPCGFDLTTSSSTGRDRRYFYYRCSGLTKRSKHPCKVKQVPAEVLEGAVLDAMRDAAQNQLVLDRAIDHAHRLAQEDQQPLHARIKHLRRDLQETTDARKRFFKAILAAGIGASRSAKQELHALEEREIQIEQALRQAEAELDAAKSQVIDLEAMRASLHALDECYEHLDQAERKELLGLLVGQVEVHKDHIFIDLYDGGEAFADLKAANVAHRQGSGKDRKAVRDRISLAPQGCRRWENRDLLRNRTGEGSKALAWQPHTARASSQDPSHPGPRRELAGPAESRWC